MKKLTFYFALLVAFSATNLFAGLKTSNAWFNGETFETYTAPYDLKTNGSQSYSGWTVG